MYDAFISYSTRAPIDAGIAAKAFDALTSGGINCWMAARSMLPGQSYGGAILNALYDSRLVVVIFSESSAASPHVRGEVERAGSRGIPFLTVRLDDAPLVGDFEFFLFRYHMLEAKSGTADERAGELVSAVKTALNEYSHRGPPPSPTQLPKRDTSTYTNIVTQVLTVSCNRDAYGSETFVYRVRPLPVEGRQQRHTTRRVKFSAIAPRLARLHDAIEEIYSGQPADPAGFDELCLDLGKHVLPLSGVTGAFKPGVHPQLSILPGTPSGIPWGLLRDSSHACDEGHLRYAHMQTDVWGGPADCRDCGQTAARVTEPLCTAYQLSHVTLGTGRVSYGGRRFLLVGGVLGGPDGAQGLLDAHFQEVAQLLKPMGFETTTLTGQGVSTAKFLEEISDPTLAGLYYVGEGRTSSEPGGSRIHLSDGPLTATQIADADPIVGFTFLNLCRGPDGAGWSFEAAAGGLGAAFSAGGVEKATIVPLWPLPFADALMAGREFYDHVGKGVSCGASLHALRVASRRRFESGESNVIWGAYRQYGDPNKVLEGASVLIEEPEFDSDRPVCRVFDERARLVTGLFSFDIRGVMLRGAKRRNIQDRELVSVADFLAGVIRVGGLMRHVLCELGVDPDLLYRSICEERENEPMARRRANGRSDRDDPRDAMLSAILSGGEGLKGDELEKVLTRWFVREEEQMSPELVAALISADERSQSGSDAADQAMIAERDIIAALMSTEAWTAAAELGLPGAGLVGERLDSILEQSGVTEDGRVLMECLIPRARRVVETAHSLAEQHGSRQITHRLLLAAFLQRRTELASRACAAAGVSRSALAEIMMAMSHEGLASSFSLSPEACARIVAPAIDAAARLADRPNAVTEDELFCGFCRVADLGFKEMLREQPLGLDLDDLPSLSSLSGAMGREVESALNQDLFESEAWGIVQDAFRYASIQGHAWAYSPHLFAALVGDGSSVAGRELKARGGDPHRLLLSALDAMAPQDIEEPSAAECGGVSARVARVLQRAGELAERDGRSRISESDLFRSLLGEKDGTIRRLLDKSGLSAPPSP